MLFMSRRARPPAWLSKRLIAALLAVAMQVLAPFQAPSRAEALSATAGLLAADVPICSDHAPTGPLRPDGGDHPASCTWCHTCCQGVRLVLLPPAPALPQRMTVEVIAQLNYEPRQPQGPPRPHPNARAPPLVILA